MCLFTDPTERSKELIGINYMQPSIFFGFSLMDSENILKYKINPLSVFSEQASELVQEYSLEF